MRNYNKTADRQLPKNYTRTNMPARRGEYTEQPSLTRPDMHMSLEEMLLRNATGKSLSVSHNGLQYTGDLIVPEIQKMDMVEIEEARRANDEWLQQLKESQNSEIEAAKLEHKKVQDAADKRAKQIEDLLKKQTTDQGGTAL